MIRSEMSDAEEILPVNQSKAEKELRKRPVRFTLKAMEAQKISKQKKWNFKVKQLYKLRRKAFVLDVYRLDT